MAIRKLRKLPITAEIVFALEVTTRGYAHLKLTPTTLELIYTPTNFTAMSLPISALEPLIKYKLVTPEPQTTIYKPTKKAINYASQHQPLSHPTVSLQYHTEMIRNLARKNGTKSGYRQHTQGS